MLDSCSRIVFYSYCIFIIDLLKYKRIYFSIWFLEAKSADIQMDFATEFFYFPYLWNAKKNRITKYIRLICIWYGCGVSLLIMNLEKFHWICKLIRLVFEEHMIILIQLNTFQDNGFSYKNPLCMHQQRRRRHNYHLHSTTRQRRNASVSMHIHQIIKPIYRYDNILLNNAGFHS